MGLFKDFKEDFSQAVNEMMPVELPESLYEYVDHLHFLMFDLNDIRAECILLYVKTSF